MSPFETEDCLFLDVSVPRKIFDAKGSSGGAPVLVWIFGGGYAFGAKNYWGNGAGLINRSEDGVIYVSINYRVGPLCAAHRTVTDYYSSVRLVGSAGPRYRRAMVLPTPAF